LSCSAYSAEVDTGSAKRIRVIQSVRAFAHAKVGTTLPGKCSVRGFGARIGQRRGVVTRLSGFLGVFGRSLAGFALRPIDRAFSPLSGPPPRPGARPRTGRGRPRSG